MTITDLKDGEYHPYYKGYIEKAKNIPLVSGLKRVDEMVSFLSSIPPSKLNYRYSDGKWTVKEVVQHLMDTERVFAYRALCIARGDQTEFPGFEQDDYVVTSDANHRDMSDMISEYTALREATYLMFRSFSSNMLTQIGTASNSKLSVRAAGFIILGHELHHCQIIKERYL